MAQELSIQDPPLEEAEALGAEISRQPEQLLDQLQLIRIEKAKARIAKNGSIDSRSYDQIALGFSLGATTNPTGNHYGERMSIHGNQLASYRTVIAIRAEREDGYFFLLDGARYSNTTDTHQSAARHYCRDRGAIIVFGLLSGPRIDPSDLAREGIWIEVREDEWLQEPCLCKNPRKDPNIEDVKGECQNYHRHWESGKTEHYRERHVLGGSLFEFRGDYYLSAMDRSIYFIAKLPRPAGSVEEAFRALNPLTEDELKSDYKRQGEWFFVPTEIEALLPEGQEQFQGSEVAYYKRYERAHRIREKNEWTGRHTGRLVRPLLPANQPGGEGHHSVGRLVELTDGSLLVQGQVRHTHREHVQLSLDKGIWYKALQNLAVRAWSSSGRGYRID